MAIASILAVITATQGALLMAYLFVCEKVLSDMTTSDTRYRFHKSLWFIPIANIKGRGRKKQDTPHVLICVDNPLFQ